MRHCLKTSNPKMPPTDTHIRAATAASHLREPQVQDVLYLGLLLIIKHRVFGTRWGRGDQCSVHGDGGIRVHYACRDTNGRAHAQAMATLSFTHHGPDLYDKQKKSRLLSSQPKCQLSPPDQSPLQEEKGRNLAPPTFLWLLCLDQHSVPP